MSANRRGYRAGIDSGDDHGGDAQVLTSSAETCAEPIVADPANTKIDWDADGDSDLTCEVDGSEQVGSAAEEAIILQLLPVTQEANTARLAHPFADMFPRMRGKPFKELVEDVRQHGIREKIVLAPDGRILDGRNRYEAAVAAGKEIIPEMFENFQFNDEAKMRAFVVSRNVHRRHLNQSQRAVGAAMSAKLHNISTEHAAKQWSVSKRTVESAKKVLDGCTDTLIVAIKDGFVRVSQAEKLAKLYNPEQQLSHVSQIPGPELSAVIRDLLSNPAGLPEPIPCGTEKPTETPIELEGSVEALGHTLATMRQPLPVWDLLRTLPQGFHLLLIDVAANDVKEVTGHVLTAQDTDRLRDTLNI